MANTFFVTADGPQPIPNEIVADEDPQAVERYITAQGWQPPPPAAPSTVRPSPAIADPEE